MLFLTKEQVGKFSKAFDLDVLTALSHLSSTSFKFCLIIRISLHYDLAAMFLQKQQYLMIVQTVQQLVFGSKQMEVLVTVSVRNFCY